MLLWAALVCHIDPDHRGAMAQGCYGTGLYNMSYEGWCPQGYFIGGVDQSLGGLCGFGENLN